MEDFPGGAVDRGPPASAGDMGFIPGPEDSTSFRATKPMRFNYWACAREPECSNYWNPRTYSLCSTVREATAVEKPALC